MLHFIQNVVAVVVVVAGGAGIDLAEAGEFPGEMVKQLNDRIENYKIYYVRRETLYVIQQNRL